MIQADAWDLPFKSNSIDCIITSPPYFGCDDYEAPEGMVKLGTEKTVHDYKHLLAGALMDCKRVLKNNGVLWLILGDDDSKSPISMAPQRVAIEMEDDGWIIAQEVHWVRMYNLPGKKRSFRHPESKTEKIYMLAKTHQYFYQTGCGGNVWKVTPARYTAGEWAVVPEKIIEKCIKASTKPGDVVLDPFCGSGGVQRVAERLGRVGIGSDINPT